MSQEWYLIKPPHGQLSGYEDEALNDFATEGFQEILDSGIATTVELYNYDLTVCKQIRAVVQKTVQDTRLNSMRRELYVPIGTCNTGMYVKYKDRYWIIYSLVDDNGMYEKAIMIICNYRLCWVCNDGHVLQRWSNIASASQYNNGEFNTRFYDLRTDQLMVTIPDDDESLMLTTGDRFIVDRRCEVYEKNFPDGVTVDCTNPVITYVLSRSDSVVFNFTSGGCNQFMIKQDEQHEDDGYYVINGVGYWLCKKHQEKNEDTASESPVSEIEYDSLEIYNGVDQGVFTAKFYDAAGKPADILPIWDIKCDFAADLNIEYVGSSICISVDNSKLVNRSFELFLNADGYETTSVIVFIRSFI